MKKINKELLSEVLGKSLKNIYTENMEGDNFLRENEISYVYTEDVGRMGTIEHEQAINIYELANKCKNWAKGRYSISSYPNYFGYGATLTDHFGESPKNLVITKNTEPEAIFEACEWIYDKEIKKIKNEI